jgi:hypothetical protein
VIKQGSTVSVVSVSSSAWIKRATGLPKWRTSAGCCNLRAEGRFLALTDNALTDIGLYRSVPCHPRIKRSREVFLRVGLKDLTRI